jgi:hypothetical protein
MFHTQNYQTKNSSTHYKVKVKCTILQAMRLCTGRTAHLGSRGITLLFQDLGTRRRWVASVTSRPLFTPGKDPVPIVQETGWTQGRFRHVRKISTSPGFDPRTFQPGVSRYNDWATRPNRCGDETIKRAESFTEPVMLAFISLNGDKLHNSCVQHSLHAWINHENVYLYFIF